MSRWHALYEAPEALTSDWGHHRIYAPESYAGLRSLLAVPVVVPEARALARHVPLCWSRQAEGYSLVALLGLRADARRILPYAELPMALRAYPFVVPGPNHIHDRALMVDRAFPDEPTDIGAPLVLDGGKLSPPAFSRAQTALQLGASGASTEALTHDLASHGLLEPWILRFDLGNGQSVALDGFHVLASQRLGDPALFALIEQHGIEAGLFLGFHRISLYRINTLLGLARAAVNAAGHAGRGAAGERPL